MLVYLTTGEETTGSSIGDSVCAYLELRKKCSLFVAVLSGVAMEANGTVL